MIWTILIVVILLNLANNYRGYRPGYGVFKFLPWTNENHPRFCPLSKKSWFQLWNSWWNPVSNYHEYLPFPEVRDDEAPENCILKWLYWQFWRNRWHNFGHFFIGIVQIGAPMEWIDPQVSGWQRVVVSEKFAYWKKGIVRLPYFETIIGPMRFYIGWKRRGCFGVAFRKA